MANARYVKSIVSRAGIHCANSNCGKEFATGDEAVYDTLKNQHYHNRCKKIGNSGGGCKTNLHYFNTHSQIKT